MARTDLGKILKQQQDLMAEARERLESARNPLVSKLSPQSLVTGKKAQLARAEARLAEATKARDAALARYEATVERRREEVERLKLELKELRGHQDKVTPGAKNEPVTSVDGVGTTFKQRLDTVGVETVGQLAKLKAKRLAEVLEIPASRAKTILDAARAKLEE